MLQGKQRRVCGGVCVCVSPVVQKSLEVLEQGVFVLIYEAHHGVPARRGRQVNAKSTRAVLLTGMHKKHQDLTAITSMLT